jgi:hypothetical protein
LIKSKQSLAIHQWHGKNPIQHENHQRHQ